MIATNWHSCIIVMAMVLATLLAPTTVASDGLLGDAQILARIAEGEAEVLGEDGMLAVMHVARNRVRDARFPDDYEAVSKAFYGRTRGEAKPDVVELALGFLTKAQGEDPTNGAIYAFSLADVRWLGLSPADIMVPDEPMAGWWQLHLYQNIDWVAWREAQREQEHGG